MKARANIEAVDKTGKTFSDIAGKMKAVDKAAAALGKAKGMKGMAQQVDAVAKSLTKVSAIDAFRGSQASFAAARTTFREAQANVSRLAAEMARAKAPTAALSREFAKAQREVRAASTAFEAQKSALIGNKRALEQTGVSLSKLVAQERGPSRRNDADDRRTRTAPGCAAALSGASGCCGQSARDGRPGGRRGR
ncbi:hypothetical protein BIWAKO_03392 [Bosea sp. BIWAKO-01]|nr:hypothetical protein BIWAKO_03392 [Bosea sp. BIWAKO-01]